MDNGLFSGELFSSDQLLAGGSHVEQLDGVCGLEGATPLEPGAASTGLTVTVGGQVYDLGSDSGSDSELSADLNLSTDSDVTLADERGVSIYSDLDGDGAVDHVTTMRFDGSWESWVATGSERASVEATATEGASSEGAASEGVAPGALAEENGFNAVAEDLIEDWERAASQQWQW